MPSGGHIGVWLSSTIRIMRDQKGRRNFRKSKKPTRSSPIHGNGRSTRQGDQWCGELEWSPNHSFPGILGRMHRSALSREPHLRKNSPHRPARLLVGSAMDAAVRSSRLVPSVNNSTLRSRTWRISS
jgi:hypothetical protein